MPDPRAPSAAIRGAARMTSLHPRPAPQKIFCPRRLAKKVGGRGRSNPWIISLFYPKSLILEKSGPTGRPSFSTGLGSFSTDCPVFSTGAFSRSTSFLSLYPIEKKEEEKSRKGKSEGSPIHGLAELPIFSSTGYAPDPRVFRGNPWIETHEKTMSYVAFDVYPRIHGKKCLWSPWSFECAS